MAVGSAPRGCCGTNVGFVFNLVGGTGPSISRGLCRLSSGFFFVLGVVFGMTVACGRVLDAPWFMRREGGGEPGLFLASGLSPASGAIGVLESSPPSEAQKKKKLEPQASGGPGDDVHVAFVVDCRPFNLWQAELLFFSALRAGQAGPITQIVSGCPSDEWKKQVEERHASLGLPERFMLHFTPTYNDQNSIWLSKPFAFDQWYRQGAGPERPVVAVIDPDFVFLRPLTSLIDGRSTAIGWQDDDRPERVKPGVVVAQRYSLGYPNDDKNPWDPGLKNLSMPVGDVLALVCSGDVSGDSGCRGVSEAEFGTYHAVGVPYIAHREDWDWLSPAWMEITKRLQHFAHPGYYIDMYSWILANVHKRRRQFIVHNLIFSSHEDPQAKFEPWQEVDLLEVDPCEASMDKVLDSEGSPDVPRGHFVHYCVPDHIGKAFNKYWFDWDRPPGENALHRCDGLPEEEGFKKMMAGRPVAADAADVKRAKRVRFIECIERRMFAAALRRTCAGHPVAELMANLSAGFEFK